MRLGFRLVIGAALTLAAPCVADMPFPANPQPCTIPDVPPGCIPATAFARYLFLPTTTPLTLPNDYGSDNWKLTSTTTGEPAIDNNPQELFGVKGASVDLAWQVTTGRPDVLIAILDSGIRWQDNLPDLVNKLYLNRGELPVPEGSSNTADPWDRNGDGVFNIQDYLADGVHAQDSRVSDQNGNGIIDPEDLIFIFSDGVDDDNNGYVDDIAGWDFFEDDNDPLDEVRYGHGTGEAEDSNAEANNGMGDVGTCPSCMVMPVRVGDSFVAEVNNFAQGVLFATDSGARLVQEALGTLNNSSLAQAAVDYAYHRGVLVVASAADEESNHHNYPANYNHTMEVNSVTKFDEVAGFQQTPHSYLYLNGCTNYGSHIAVAVPSSSCSSEATGKSSGMAGLVLSAALNEIDRGHLTPYPNGDGTLAAFPLSANEVKQVLTLTADDINFDARPDAQPPLPQNYATSTPFPGVQMSERFHSIAGWDQYFGYGRINANAAVHRVMDGQIPPEAEITAPAWFQIVNPDAGTLALTGRVAANRAPAYTYSVDTAPGVQPAEGDFVVVEHSDTLTAPQEGTLAQISLTDIAARMPNGVDGPSADASGRGDEDRFTFTVRVRATDSLGNVGEDRRTYFLHRDPDLIGGAPVQLSSDGTASPVLADLDGVGVEEIILATSDGFVHAYRRGGPDELSGWPVHTDPLEAHTGAAAFRSGEVPATPFAAMLAAPAVGDLDRDGQLEVIAADEAGKLYVWDHNGILRPGFPVSTLAAYSNSRRSERDLSTPDGRVPDRTNRHTSDNRLARGFGTSPSLGNLDGSADGSLEIIIGALDRHVYVWHADGTPVPGWPALLKDPSKVQSVDPVTNEVTLISNSGAAIGTKIITPASLGDIDGDGTLDVVIGVNEEYVERPNAVFNNLAVNFYRAAGVLQSGNGRTYALFHDGTAHGANPIDHGWNPDAFMPGWPVKVAMVTTELLPTVGTGINGSPALADLDKDGHPEVAVFSFIGPIYVFNGQGHSFLGDDPAQPGIPRTLEVDTFGTASNSVDTPAFPALGGGVLAQMDPAAGGFQFVAPTAGFGKLVDNNVNERQTPSDNQLGVWDVATADGRPGSGAFRPAFPRLVNDLQFLTSPSVADIDGDGLPEALEGTAVYDLHAFNVNGAEPTGWPKLTGGWMTGTAASGDVDGDGRLEVVAATREGSLFIWRTSAGECSAIPWRQGHHDEWNTSNYATDARPPAALLPQNVSLSTAPGGVVNLTLSGVPGDNLYCGPPAIIDARYAAQPILTDAQFTGAAEFQALDRQGQSGRNEHGAVTLRAQAGGLGNVYVAARTVDDARNRSPITALGQVTLQPDACAGDCDDSGAVTVDELMAMVNVALDNAAVVTCIAGDRNRDGAITVDEILLAVRSALDACS
jgi:hypothetical protein